MSKWLDAGDKLDIFEDLEWHLKKCKDLYQQLEWENNAGYMEQLIDEFQCEKEEAQDEVNHEIESDLQELNDYYYSTRL